MIDVTVDQLSRRWPGIEIFVASYAKVERRDYGTHFVAGIDGPAPFEFIANSRSPLRFLRVALARLLPDSWHARLLDGDRYLATFRNVDFVVDISGFALSDQRSAVRRLVYGLECFTASALGLPIFLLTQAFGPFESRLSRLVARWALPRAALIVARDQASLNHVRSLGLQGSTPLHQCSDMALLLPTSESAAITTIDRPALGIVPNVNLLTGAERAGTPGKYVKALAAVADVGARLGAHVVFVCYESFPDRGVDDVWIARAAIAEAGAEEIELVSDANAIELKSIVAGLDLLVGARYHSLVAAVSSTTPFLAIGWAHKYDELAAEAGVSNAFLDGRSSPLESILAAVEQSWLCRSETRRVLERGLPALLESAGRAFDLLESLLSTGESSEID